MAGVYGQGDLFDVLLEMDSKWMRVESLEGWRARKFFLSFLISHRLVAIALMHRWIMRDEG